MIPGQIYPIGIPAVERRIAKRTSLIAAAAAVITVATTERLLAQKYLDARQKRRRG